ncbi:RING-H2 finger protein ATL3-like [Amaranthus tricolor]|uniref:RING-H2 finger protein ATL3-like n=1 Tax=Amaranthus tricolor TaxID=29722 RepID=UPI002586D805|nr:RING-H2 finger protein ATL3-like [Amaranthus tricolor]
MIDMVEMTVSPPPLIDPTTSKVSSISTQIMTVTIIVLFFVVAFCFFLQLYAKRFWVTPNEDQQILTWRRQLVLQRSESSGPAHQTGLDPATLDSLPVVEYNPKDFKDGLECSVCLCEISQGEKTRLLPKCNHGFHLECIDMWFQSHSTCPLCRNPVTFGKNLVNVEVQDHENGYDSSEFPNSDDENDGFAISYDGSLSLGSSTSGGNDHEIVIEIPSGGVDDEFCEDCLSSPKVKAAKTPVMRRLASLKRLLSLGKRLAVTSPSVASCSCDAAHQV